MEKYQNKKIGKNIKAMMTNDIKTKKSFIINKPPMGTNLKVNVLVFVSDLPERFENINIYKQCYGETIKKSDIVDDLFFGFEGNYYEYIYEKDKQFFYEIYLSSSCNNIYIFYDENTKLINNKEYFKKDGSIYHVNMTKEKLLFILYDALGEYGVIKKLCSDFSNKEDDE